MNKRKSAVGLNALFQGFSELVERLGEFAEKGEQLSKNGEINFKGREKDLKGVYGFSVKIGLGGEEIKLEPFGNIRRDDKSGQAVVHEVREPIVDVFEEKDHILIVAEMPGISKEDLQLDVSGDLLTIYAEKGEKKYRKEILLPMSYPKEKMFVSCNNGILEIKCTM